MASERVGENFFAPEFPDGAEGNDWPAVGTDAWIKRLLLRLFDAVQQAAYEKFGPGPYPSMDQDKYVYLMIPARHRRLHKLLVELVESHGWIASFLDPRDEEIAHLVQQSLKCLGVNARILVRYRDVDEKLVIS